jgi:hypothetical protein
MLERISLFVKQTTMLVCAFIWWFLIDSSWIGVVITNWVLYFICNQI